MRKTLNARRMLTAVFKSALDRAVPVKVRQCSRLVAEGAAMRHTEAEIIEIMAQAAEGDIPAVEVCRINGISEQTFYRWKRSYSGLTTSEVKRLRELEAENARLKRLLAERDLRIDEMQHRLSWNDREEDVPTVEM